MDVTLACEGQQVSAHKVVLSACSPYFRSLLKVSIRSGHQSFTPIIVSCDTNAPLSSSDRLPLMCNALCFRTTRVTTQSSS